MDRVRIALILLSVPMSTAACFDGSGLKGAPCLADEDCGPKLQCIASVCGGGDSNVAGGRWPDSATIYCSDTTTEVETCPAPGNPGYGQDGNYQINVPTYEEVDDGIIVDSVTQLEWEEGSSFSDMSRADALLRCENLQLGGREWRLPSRLELVSLLNYGRDPTFPGIHEGRHWTSSDTGQPGEGWAVSFIDLVPSREDEALEYRTMCVSGAPLQSSFSVDSETIRDALTGLEWQRGFYDNGVTWTEALSYCEGLTLAGADDWRLPSAKECLTLARDDQQLREGLDGDNQRFWTSSPVELATRAATFGLPEGTIGADEMIYENVTRCVRGG